MQGESPLRSFVQHPILTPSTAAREATPLDAAPRHSIQQHQSTPQAGNPTTRESSSMVAFKDIHQVPTSHAGTTPKRLVTPGAEINRNGPYVAASVTPEASREHPQASVTEFRIGIPEKHFTILTALLVQESPYFAGMRNTEDNPQPPHRLGGPFHFKDLDEFAFSLFMRWIHGEELHGPHDFHSLNHYLGLYITACKFQIEALVNTVMDMIRRYYHIENMTAPAFRLEYVYSHTDGPCLMRDFLVSTATYRALAETEQHSNGLSESIKDVLRKGGEIASDFSNSLCTLVRNGREDARKGDSCLWHSHEVTPVCKRWGGPEPCDSS